MKHRGASNPWVAVLLGGMLAIGVARAWGAEAGGARRSSRGSEPVARVLPPAGRGAPILPRSRVARLPARKGLPPPPLARLRPPRAASPSTSAAAGYVTYLGGAANDEAVALARDAAGNIYLLGESSSPTLPGATTPLPAGRNVFVSKFSPDGAVLFYTVVLGGSADDTAGGIAVDSAGRVYIAGGTRSADFPVTGALQSSCAPAAAGQCSGDAFVAQLGPDGALVFSSYFGGSADDRATAVALDSGGRFYVTGATSSSDFPVLQSLQPASGRGDAFVAKFSPPGALIYSTYLGGGAEDTAYALVVDAAGGAVVAGETRSPDFPAVNAFQPLCRVDAAGGCADAFLARIAPDGSAISYATFLGGSGTDFARAVALDGAGNAWVAGATDSPDFPVLGGWLTVSAGATDAFLARLSPDGGILQFSTYLGGSAADAAAALAVDAVGSVFLTGSTASADLPTVNPVQAACAADSVTGECSGDSFVAVLNPAGTLNFLSYLGGSGPDAGKGLAPDNAGNVWLAASVASPGLTSPGALQPALAGSGDALLAQLTGVAVAKPGGGPLVTACTGTIQWTGLVNNNWNNAGNWTPAGPPGAGADACIPPAFAGVTIDINGLAVANQSINSLISNAHLQMSGTTLNVAAASTVDANLTVAGGTLALNGATGVTGTLTQSAGALAGSGVVTIAGLFTWAGGTQDGGGTTTANGGISLTTTTRTIRSRVLNNPGTATWTAGRTDHGLGAVINNSGTWDAQSDDDFLFNQGGTRGTFNNSGTLTKSAGTVATDVDMAVNNTHPGVVSASSGTLSLNAGGTSTGSFSATGAAVVDFGGLTQTITLDAAASIGGTGTIRFSGGATTIAGAGSYNVAGTTQINGGTASFTQTLASTNLLTLSGGTLGGTGTLAASGLFTWAGGSQDGGGTTTANGGFTWLTTSKVIRARTLNLNSAGAWVAGRIDHGVGAVINNSGAWDWQSDDDFLFNQGGARGVLNNTGTITKSGGAATKTVDVTWNHTVTGILNANSGTLQLAANSTSAGAYNVAATLQFSGSTHNWDAGTTFAGTGTTLLSSGSISVNATIPMGSLLNLNGATLTGTGTLETNNTFTWTAGVMDGGGITNVNATLALSGTGVKTLRNRTLNTLSAVTWSAGRFDHGVGAVINNTSTWDIQSDDQFFFSQGNPRGVFNNDGTVTKSGGLTTKVVDIIFNNPAGGVVNANSGTLLLTADSTSSGTYNVAAILLFDTSTHNWEAGVTFTGAGTTRINGGAVNVNAAVPMGSLFHLAGGTLTGTGTLDTNSTFTWTGGTQDGGGITNINATLVMNSTGVKVQRNRVLNTPGAVTWTSGRYDHGVGAVINNTGTWDFQNDDQFFFSQGGTRGVFQNNGTVTKSGGAGTKFVDVTFNNPAGGVVNTNSGTLQLVAGSTSAGSYNVGAVLVFDSGTHDWNAGVTFAGAGTTRLGNGTVNVNATVPLGSQFTQTGGTLTGAGTLDVNGVFTWTGGTQDGGGTTNVNGTLLLNTTGVKTQRNRVLNTPSAVTWTSGRYDHGVGAVINNTSTWDIQNDDQFFFSQGGTRGVFQNNGTVTKSGGAGTKFVDVTFNNPAGGVVNANSGTLQLIADSTSAGSYNVAAVLRFDSDTHNWNAGVTFAGAGTTRLVTGTANVNTTVPMGSQFDQAGGTLTGTGTLNVNGAYTWSGGVQTGGGITNANNALTLATTGTKTLLARTLNTLGPVTWLAGRVDHGQGAVINNSGAWVAQTNDQQFFSQGGTRGVFNNLPAGSYTKTLATGSSFMDMDFNNQGTLVAASGTLNFTSTLAQASGLTRLNGGSITVAVPFVINGGTLDGNVPGGFNGAINNVAGTIAPGTSAGTVNVTGVYTQGGGAAFNLEIGGTAVGTQYDRLSVSSTATLAGTLNVTLINGFTPSGGEIFTFLSAGTRNGTFAVTNLPALPGGLTWNVSYTAVSALLQVSGTPTCTINFDNGAGNNLWQDALNWDSNVLPQPADSACITGFAVTLSSGTHSVDRFVTDSPFTISGGTLTLLGATGNSGVNNTFTHNGGTLDGNGGLTISGLHTWSGGTLDGGGAVSSNGGLTLTTATTKVLRNRTLSLNAGAVWNGGAISHGLGAVVNLPAGQTFDIQGDLSFSFGQGGARGVFNNGGTLLKSAGLGTATVDVSLVSTAGMATASAGVLSLAGGSAAVGSGYSVAAGATLQFNAGTHTLDAGSAMAGAGALDFNGTTVSHAGATNITGGVSATSGTANLTGTVTSLGPLTVSGGTLNLSQGTPAVVTVPSLTQNSGTLTGSDPIVVTGPYQWTGGTLDGNGSSLDALGGLGLGGGATKVLRNRILNLTQGATWTGGAISHGQGAVINLPPGRTFDIQGDLSFSFGQGGVRGTLNITSGGLQKSSGSGTATVDVLLASSNASVDVLFGTMQFNGGSSAVTTMYSVPTGATLLFNAGTHDLDAGSSIVGDGVVNFSGATVNHAGTYQITGSTIASSGVANLTGFIPSVGDVSISGGTLNLSQGGTVTMSSLSLTAGALTGSAPVDVAGAFTWSGGTLDGTGNALNVLNGVTLSGSTKVLRTRTLNLIAGAATWTSGVISHGQGAIINVPSGGFFDMQGDLTFGFGQGGLRGVFSNSGFVVKSAGAGAGVIDMTFTTDGTINLASGTLNFTSNFVQNAPGLTALQGGNLGGGITFTFAGGTLAGAGLITGNIINNGAFLFSGAPVGTLAISGSYVQDQFAALIVDLSGTAGGQFDVVAVGGAATLGGHLEVQSFGGFVPATGNTFQVMTFASRTGDFATFNDSTGSLATLTTVPGATNYLLNYAGGPLTCTINFDNGAGNNLWQDPLNWDTNVLPGSTDTACIPAGFNPNLSSGSHSIDRFSSDSPLILSGGTLTLLGSSGGSSANDSFTLSGATLGGASSLAIGGQFTWSGGTMEGGGVTTTSVPALINPGFAVALRDRTLNLNAGAAYTSGFISHGLGAVINLPAGQTFDIQGDLGFSFGQGGVRGVFNNFGTVVKSAGTGFSDLDVTFNHNGALLDVASGTIRFNTNLTSAALISVNGALDLSSGTHTFNSGTVLGGPGTLILRSTENFNAGSMLAIQAVQLPSGTTTFSTGGPVTIPNFLHNGGTLTGSSQVNVTTSYVWSGGALDGGGSVNANTQLTINPGFAVALRNRTLNLNAGAVFTSGFISHGAGAVFNLPAGQTFNIQGDLGFSFGQGGTRGVFNNNGTFVKSAGTGFSDIDVTFNHLAGAINIPTGTMRFNFDLTAAAPVSVTGTLDLSGGARNFNSGASVTGTGTVVLRSAENFNAGSALTITNVQLPGGTTTLATGSNVTIPNFTHNGGALVGTGQVDVTTSYIWSGGALGGGGTTNANALLTINPGFAVALQSRTLNLNAGAVFTSGFISHGQGAVFNLPAGQTFNIQGDRGFSFGQGGMRGVFNNNGTFVKSAGTGFSDIDVTFNHNAGAINIPIGTMRFNFDLTAAAPINVTGTLDLSGGTRNFNSGATVSGTGTVILRVTENFNAGSALTITNVQLPSGTTMLATGGTVTIPNFNHNGGTLTGAGQVDVTTSYTWSGGVLGGGGITNANAPLTINPGFAVTLQSRILNLNAGAVFTSGFISHGQGAVFNLPAGQTFDIQGNLGFSFGQGGTRGAFNNSGTFVKSAGTGFSDMDVTFNHNAGAVNISAGTMRFNFDLTSAAPFNVTGALDLSNGTHTFNSGAAVGGTGSVVLRAAENFNAGSALTITNVQVASGVTTLGMAGPVTIPNFNHTAGTLGGTAQVDVTNSYSWTGGDQDGGGVTNANTLLTINPGFAVTIRSRTLNLNAGANFTNGFISHGQGAVINVPGGQTFNITGDFGLSFGQGGMRGVFNNAGILTKSAGAGASGIDVDLVNTGTVLAASGTLSFTSSYAQSAGSTALNGGNLAGGITYNFTGGLLTGAGSISGSVNNNGAIVAPGVTTGTLTISGTYTQSASGTLTIKLGGTGAGSFDVLAVGGTATLAGTLNLASFGGFIPAGGNSFQIMTFANRSGDFTAINDTTGSPFVRTPAPGATNYVINYAAAGPCVNFDGGGDGVSFHDPLNWDTDAVPTGVNDACVGGSFAVTFSAASGTRTVNSLTVTSTAPFTLSGGSLTLNTASPIDVGGFNFTGGTLSGGGAVTITGPFNWSGGNMIGAGTTTSNGGMNLTGNVDIGPRTLNLNSNSVWSAGTLFHRNGAVFNNTDPFDIQGDLTASFQGGAATAFNNSGALSKSAGVGTAIFDLPLNNLHPGTLISYSGTVSLRGGGSSTGTFLTNPGATIDFGGGAHVLNVSAGASLGGAGTLGFSAGSATITTAGTHNAGSLLLTGGAAVLNLTLNANTVDHLTGTLGGTGMVTSSGLYTWSGGVMSGGGATNAQGGMVINGNVDIGPRTLSLSGNSFWTTGLLFHRSGAVINNAGTFEIQADLQSSFQGGAASAFNNNGALLKSGGTGTAIFDIPLNSTHPATVTANFGTLSLRGGGSSTGSFTAGGGATVEFDGGTHTIALNAGATIGAAGTIGFSAGTATISGPAGNYNTTATRITGGTATLNLNGATGTLTMTSGALGGAGTLDVSGATTWNGGAMNGGGVTNASGGVNIGGNVDLGPRTLTLGSASTWTAGFFFHRNGAVIQNNGSFDIQAGVTSSFQGGAASSFTNSGTVFRSGSGTATLDFPFSNNGSVSLTGGALNFTASFLQTGGGTNLSGGSLGGGITFNFNGGFLTGQGAITGNVSNAGASLRPGGTGIATLSITGNYTQTTGSLQVELGGTGAGQFDVLAVGGAASLAGTITAAGFGGFVPGGSDAFAVMTYASVAGDFTTKNLTIGPTTLTATPLATSYLLSVGAANFADVSLTLVDSPDPVGAGNALTYTATVSNAGPLAATNVTLTNTLPGAVNFISFTPSQGSCSGTATITCTLGTINSGGNATVTIQVSTTGPGNLTSTATVTATETDPSPANNSATANTTVGAFTSIGPLVYTCQNDSPFFAAITAGTVALETFEDGLFNVAGATASAGSVLGPSGATDSVDCDDGVIDGFGTAGRSFFSGAGSTGITFTFNSVVLGGFPTQAGIVWTDGGAGSTITFEAFDAVGASLGVVTGNHADGSNAGTTGEDRFYGITNPGGISAIRIRNTSGGIEVDHLQFGPVTPAAPVDLTLTKSDSPDPVSAGANITYTLTITNNGPSNATGVTLTDPLPAGLSLVSHTPSQGVCSLAGATVTCGLGTINNGAGATVTIVVTAGAAAAPSVTNTATVNSAENETNPGDNTASQTTTVTAVADVALTLVDSPDPVGVGANLTYALNVSNAGPSAATGVTVTDTLPGTVTFVSASPGCAHAAGVVTCNVGTLAAGGNVSLSIVVSTTIVTTLTNTASVAAAQTDPNTANNSATENTAVVTGPIVLLAPATLAFASQPVGSTSPPQAVTLSNTGNAPLTITSITITGNFAQTSTCGASLAAGAQCFITATFSPAGTGALAGTLTITTNALGSPHTVALSGTGILAPAVSLSSSSVVFGTQSLGATSAAQTVTLTNSGSSTLTITSITATGEFAQTNNCGASVAVGVSCAISITFTPTGAGIRTGAITIVSNAPGSPPIITLTGIGASAGVTVTPNLLVFGAQGVGSTSVAQTVTYNNRTSATVTISGVTISGDFAQSNNCGGPVAGGATCTFAVIFTPTQSGAHSGLLTITDSGAGSPRVVALSGTGLAAALTVNPAGLAFAAQPVGTTSGAQVVTVANSGGTAVTFSGITVTGDFAQTNNCGASLVVGASCSISVTFAPTTTGALAGAVNIANSTATNPVVISLTGAAVSSGAAAGLSAAQLGFGAQVVATTSAAQAVTLTNTGNAVMNIGAIATTGDFAQTNNCGVSLAVGTSCGISVTFTPTVAGTRAGALTITSNAGGSPHAVSLTGTGTPSGPIVNLSAATLSFGNVALSRTSAVQPVTLTNTGNSALTILSITATGDFAQTNTCGASLAAAANCTISVTFGPAAVGLRSGAVTITSNAAGSPHTIALTGTGTDFTITFPSGFTATVNAGQPATFSASFVPAGGFNEQVTVACTGTPLAAICTASQGSFVLSGPTSVTFTVTTTAPSAAPPAPLARPYLPPPVPLLPMWLLPLLMLLTLAALARARRARAPWATAAVVVLAVMTAACAGGVGLPPGAGGGAGTPAGNYTLTITATSQSGLVRSSTVTLTVR